LLNYEKKIEYLVVSLQKKNHTFFDLLII